MRRRRSSVFLAVLPLTWPQQAVLGLLSLLMALAMARSSDSYLVTLTLMMMSMFCTFRYGYWRIAQVVRFFQDPANHWGALDAFFIICLLLAEAYAFVILFLGYFQTIWPLRRAPVALPENTEEWPHVDVLIPTYNEPLDVVRYTALGALNMDWPADKLHVYILDDGRRKEFEQFAFEAGIGYMTRPDNKHAKAGNINTALKSINSPLRRHLRLRPRAHAQLSADDRGLVPARPQAGHAADAAPLLFARSVRAQPGPVPHHSQRGRAVLRHCAGRQRLLERDLLLRLLRGAAPRGAGRDRRHRRRDRDRRRAHLAAHADERLEHRLHQHSPGGRPGHRAALGARRPAHPLGARHDPDPAHRQSAVCAAGSSFPQRLCYFNAMCHFLYAVPRLIFLTAPLIYLLLSHTNIPGYWAAILAYALPHLTLSNVTNSRIQGEHRHSFWNEIYETVLSPYILLPTMMALINPKLGKFNVTAKGGVVKRTFFDTKIAQPFLIMLLFNIAGLLVAIPRFFIWDRDRPGTVIMNVIWCFFNIVILGVCTAVAREMRQLRTTVRINVVTPVMASMPDGRLLAGETIDMSSGGTSIRFSEPVDLARSA